MLGLRAWRGSSVGVREWEVPALFVGMMEWEVPALFVGVREWEVLVLNVGVRKWEVPALFVGVREWVFIVSRKGCTRVGERISRISLYP